MPPPGPYEWVRAFQPDGLPSFDMGVFTEGAAAYLVRSVDNQYLGVSQLSPDYSDTTGLVSTAAQVRGCVPCWVRCMRGGPHLFARGRVLTPPRKSCSKLRRVLRARTVCPRPRR